MFGTFSSVFECRFSEFFMFKVLYNVFCCMNANAALT